MAKAKTTEKKATNYDKMLKEIGEKHNPFIVYDVETTGIMNGNDNRITQMSLVAYAYNDKNSKYELQDQIFMLAKPDEKAIREIQRIETEQSADPEGTAMAKLMDDYVYSLVKKETDEEKKADIISMGKSAIDYLTVGRPKDETLKYADGFVAVMFKDDKTEKELADSNPELYGFCKDFNSYSYNRTNAKLTELASVPTAHETLEKQGLDLEQYIKDGKGLTATEMQVGITEFLNKYHTDDTVFVNNGTHFANHYLKKENLTLLGYDDNKDKVIDLIQAQRSYNARKDLGSNYVRWTADVGTFAENYKKETGKEIKTFDALTKGLCMGEITAKACGMTVSLTSEKYLENKVSESAMSKDNDYVMSMARASSINWLPDYTDRYDDADYHFNSLDYVDFGNDRRYVDIDKMFEMNDNFEITLEGEKEPIKTWEELEAKIKALNSEISDSLLEKIHEKYEEITQTAEKERKDDLMNRYEMENLDISALSEEDFKFLDKEYDLQHNSWAMAERHKDVKEAFIKAVENGDYEIIDLPNDQKGSQVIEKGLRVMGLSDEHGTKSYHGVIGMERNVVFLMDASIDIYDGINANPVYSMDITSDDFDRLADVLKKDTAKTKEEQLPMNEKTYDVAVLHDHVYIGMEDVAVTYSTEKKQGLSAQEVGETIANTVEQWDKDPTVIRERAGNGGYYPNEHKASCRVLVAESGSEALEKGYCGCISNWNDISRCISAGAVEFDMRDGMKACGEKFVQLTGTELPVRTEPVTEPVKMTEQEKTEALIEQCIALKDEETTLNQKVADAKEQNIKFLNEYLELGSTFIDKVRELTMKLNPKQYNARFLSYWSEDNFNSDKKFEITIPNHGMFDHVVCIRFIKDNGKPEMELSLNRDVQVGCRDFHFYDLKNRSDLNETNKIIEAFAENGLTKEALTEHFWKELGKDLKNYVELKSQGMKDIRETVKTAEKISTMQTFGKSDVDIPKKQQSKEIR